MTTKYFLDPVCGYGNTVEVYINNRLPEIIDEFDSREAAVHYICENEVYMFNYKNLQDSIEAKYMLKKYGVNAAHVYHIDWDENNVEDYFEKIMSTLVENNFKNIINGMPKFDYIIQNPPYNRSLHLDFFETSLQMLSSTGKMVIVEPSTWLINLRKTAKAKRYNLLKDKIDGHVKSIKIETLNHEFNINGFCPLSITTIDMSRTYDTIDFTCCGEHKTVNSIYECNLIGKYNIVQSIINKCISYNDVMKNHITKDIIDNNYYLRIFDIIKGYGYNLLSGFINTKNGVYYLPYVSPCINKNDLSVYDYIPVNKNGNKCTCVCGTEQELENWKYYIYNNKLPLFINICVSIDQNNVSAPFIPWIVDKQYTDEEIYDLLGITAEEQELIDNIVNKYERSSDWFKRFLEGPNWKQYCK